ncbi:MAG TPA: LysR family transcriptional regulator [Candidatus Competibacteraceae bacterium]|nr:LysR family transcriptional regulator [Candidatus Competibacteraceae bacterium]
MDINRLAIFARVVELESFGKAAASLGLSKSSVSRTLAALEAEVGTRLLERTTRRLRLTEAGAGFYQRIRPLLRELQVAVEQLQGSQAQPRGVLRLASPYEYGVYRLAEYVCRFMSRYPTLRVEVELTNREIDLLEEPFDIVFRIQPTPLPDSSLMVRQVGAPQRHLVAAPQLLARIGQPRDLVELAALPCLVHANERVWRFSVDGVESSVQPAGPLVANSTQFLRVGALAGLGITVLSEFFCRDELAEGRLVELLPESPPVPTAVYAVCVSRRLMATKVRLFLDFMTAELPPLPPPRGRARQAQTPPG